MCLSVCQSVCKYGGHSSVRIGDFYFFGFFYIREQYDDLLSFKLDNVILFCCSFTILPYMNIGIYRYISFMLLWAIQSYMQQLVHSKTQ